MRVEGRGAARPHSEDRQRAEFDDALARAGRRDAARAGEGRLASPRPREAGRRLGGATVERGAPREELRAAAVADALREARSDPAPVPELSAVARAAPPAITVRSTEGAPLALSFGPSLAVELRSAAAGVAVLLRPGPGLASAAEAELPRLVAALRVRGVPVASAEVGRRSAGGGRAR